MNVLRQRRQDRTQIEQLVLYAQQDRREISQPALVRCHTRRTQERVQFIDRAVGGNACTVLGNALPADQPGLALITRRV